MAIKSQSMASQCRFPAFATLNTHAQYCGIDSEHLYPGSDVEMHEGRNVRSSICGKLLPKPPLRRCVQRDSLIGVRNLTRAS